MIEQTLKSFCAEIKAECEIRGIPYDFLSCAWHSFRPEDAAVAVSLHKRNGGVEVYSGESFVVAMQRCRDGVSGMAPTVEQLAEILGVPV